MTKTTDTITKTDDPDDPFVKIITEWDNRQILTTLTKEEREHEYLIAVEKLQDFIKLEMEKEDDELMQEIRRARIELSLRSRILTEEEEEEESNKIIEEYEKSIGRKLDRI